MKRKHERHIYLFMPILLGLLFFAGVLEIKAVAVYGVTSSNQLVRFGAGNLGTVTTVGTITGLQSGETIKGIDFRPATGELYALGSNSRLYVINKFTAQARPIGNGFSVPLNGTNFGFDFNPVIDRIRIVSDADQNLVANPNDGSNVQVTPLFYANGDPNQGQNPNVTGSAYDRSFIGTTGTQLYGVDTNLNILVRQANSAGTLNTVGPLGFDVPDVFGFDHTAASNVAYATWSAGGVVRLYTINLMTGAATNLGAVGNNDITDISLEIGSSEGLTAYGLTNANQLVTFSTRNPNAPTRVMTIGGLQAGETIKGIDLRPATGELFAFGTTLGGSNPRLYTINPTTAIATFVAAIDQDTSGNDFGFDFNPTVDRIRIVNETDINRRANPNNGATIIDGMLAYANNDVNAGANPNIVAAGYENSFGGATTTRLFDIDSNLDILVQQNPANAGTLLTVGSLTWNVSKDAGFDIIRGSNRGIAALNLVVGGSPQQRSELYEVNTATGTAAFIAPIGVNAPIISLTVSSPTAVNRLDTNRNGLGDYAVFRPSNNTWNILEQSGQTNSFVFGNAATDLLQPGDYDGDGVTDAAVWRRTNGTWYIVNSSTNTSRIVRFGVMGDEPVARDFDGDGKADIAVVRRMNGQMIWYILNSLDGSLRVQQFGLASDFIAPGDYDGDGRFDLAVFRTNGDNPAFFYIQQSTAGFRADQFGISGDLVAPGDYDGDGKTDIALVRQGQPYTWFILRSSDNTLLGLTFGTKPHFVAQNDYDGDGRTDIAVYDPVNAIFYVLKSSDNGLIQQPFGQSGDYPIANYDVH